MPGGGIGFATLKGFAALNAHRDTLDGIREQLQTERRLSANSGTSLPIFFSFASKENSGEATLRVQANSSDTVVRVLLEWLGASSR